jgi:hypothetical protein
MTDKKIHPPSGPIDEALWSAYRRDDKAAVMDYLFGRSLVGAGCSRSFHHLVIEDSSEKGRAAKRAHAEPMLINDGVRQVSLRSTLN